MSRQPRFFAPGQRYRATIVDTETYFFACMRYIELNPVRAGMVSRPDDYLWSSHSANVGGTPDPLVTSHELYEALGVTAAERQHAYRELFGTPLTSSELQEIR